jgi:uncharacterized alpha-E superfamily protein
MLSRVAENLYWMGRYMERAEDTARLIQVSRHVMLDFPGTATLGWSSLINITGSDELFDKHYGKRDEASVLAFLCADRRYSGSIVSALGAARANLRTTREVMPREVWEEVNQLYHAVNEQASQGISVRHMDGFLKGVIRGCQTLTGMIIGTLSHTPARTFTGMGCYLERADMTTRTLDVRSANLLPRAPGDLTPFENLQWMGVLKSLSAYQMYRQQVRHRVRGPEVVRFILKDPQFPRSINRCLMDLHRNMYSLPRNGEACAVVTALQNRFDVVNTDWLAGSPDDLHCFVDDLQVGIGEIHDAIKSTWFAGVDEPAPVIGD